MAIYRNVQLSFWTDAKIVDDFDPVDRYVFMYLMTNPHTNLCGCYELSMKQAADETGIAKEKVREVISKLQEELKVIDYDPSTKEVLILNWSKYNWTKSEGLLQAIRNEAEGIKSDRYKKFIIDRTNGQNSELEAQTERVGGPSPHPGGTTVAVSVTDSLTDQNVEGKRKTSPRAREDTKAADDLFEKAWALYPEKKGKQKVSAAKKKELLKVGEEKLLKAIQRYIDEHNRMEREGWAPHWQNGSTFFNSGYVDYLDENYAPSPPQTLKARAGPHQRGNRFNNFEQRGYDFDELERGLLKAQG